MNFAQTLLNWYHRNKRELPWRSTNDPYIIWLSEIILQQTRVDQGLPYFQRFAESYPTVRDFAAASEDEILRHWQGLGYYSRGRNMHKTAQLVMEDHAGYFPKKFDQLIRLKGIGEYTAAAISSFSANEAKAVVDGNVFRVLARYFGINEPINTGKGKKTFTELAQGLLDPDQPGTFNQAIMEFGALQCKPKNPDCDTCPLSTGCVARTENRIPDLPVKLKSGTLKHRYFNFLVLKRAGKIAIQKREGRDIWENLYQFPLIETTGPIGLEELILNADFLEICGTEVQIKAAFGPIKQRLSHQMIHARFIEVNNFKLSDAQTIAWLAPESINALGKPKIISDFSKKYLY